MLGCTMTRCCKTTMVRTKKKLYHRQEVYPTAKELCVTTDEPCTTTKVPCISAKKPCISSASVCTLTGCGDMTCSGAATSAPYTSTPLPTTTAGHPTWGNRYIHLEISSSKDMLTYIYIHVCGMCKSVLF